MKLRVAVPIGLASVLLLGVNTVLAEAPCDSPCDLHSVRAAIDVLATLEAFHGAPIYVEDGACDGTVAALPPDYRPPPVVLEILQCADCAAPELINHLDDPRPTTALFKGGEQWNQPITVPLGYVCLDLLSVLTPPQSVAYDTDSANDDGLGSGMRPSFYFRPDAFRQVEGGFLPSPKVLEVKEAWKSAMAAGALKFGFREWW